MQALSHADAHADHKPKHTPTKDFEPWAGWCNYGGEWGVVGMVGLYGWVAVYGPNSPCRGSHLAINKAKLWRFCVLDLCPLVPYRGTMQEFTPDLDKPLERRECNGVEEIRGIYKVKRNKQKTGVFNYENEALAAVAREVSKEGELKGKIKLEWMHLLRPYMPHIPPHPPAAAAAPAPAPVQHPSMTPTGSQFSPPSSLVGWLVGFKVGHG